MKSSVKRAKPVTKFAAKAATKKSALKAAAKAVPTQPVSSPKVVSPILRDSFTLPTADQELLKRCTLDAVKSGRDSRKKREIVRATLRHFASPTSAMRRMELNQLDQVETGRRKKKEQ